MKHLQHLLVTLEEPRPVRTRSTFAGFLLAVFLLGPWAGLASGEAAPEDVERSARAINGDFMSPYCPGLLLGDCRSPAAVELRAEVRRDLEAGVSEAELRARLEAEFGEKLLAAPHARGFGLVAWLTPYVMVIAGMIAIFAWMLSHRRTVAPEPERKPADPARLARLEEERRASL
ncbi:MAG: cytochrome c-type biogenesis protein CcmH [Candidatus Binatia bacterium]